MILFLDGPDGAGKTTLLDRVARAAPDLGLTPVVAPALWTYIEPIRTPDDFAAWVTTTPGAEIAWHLIDAMRRRLDALAHAATTAGPATTLRLVDRGPKTVVCSAVAHIAASQTPASASSPVSAIDQALRAFDTTLARLAAVETITTVELHPPDLSLLLRRLRPDERSNPAYTDYLAHLCRRFEDPTLHFTAAATLHLPAEHEPETNLANTLAHLVRAGALTR
jgi:hypothetical protein